MLDNAPGRDHRLHGFRKSHDYGVCARVPQGCRHARSSRGAIRKPAIAIEELTIYSKYRDVGGGVQWPFAIQRERNGEKIFEMYSDSVTIDQSLLDDLFRVEGKMKILPMK